MAEKRCHESIEPDKSKQKEGRSSEIGQSPWWLELAHLKLFEKHPLNYVKVYKYKSNYAMITKHCDA